MRLVEDSARVLSVGRKVVCHDAADPGVSAYLNDTIKDVIHRLSFLIRYDISIATYATDSFS